MRGKLQAAVCQHISIVLQQQTADFKVAVVTTKATTTATSRQMKWSAMAEENQRN